MTIASEFLGCLMFNFISTGVLSSTAVLTFGELLAPRLVVLALGSGFGYLAGLFTSSVRFFLNFSNCVLNLSWEIFSFLKEMSGSSYTYIYILYHDTILINTLQGGGYLNPAITASLMALYPLNKGKMSPLQGLLNMLAQLLGTAVGIALVVRSLSLSYEKFESSRQHTHTHRSESSRMQTKAMKIWEYRHLRTVRLQEADLLSKPWELSL